MAVTKQPDVPRRRTRYPLIIAALSVLSLLFLLPFIWACLTAIKPFRVAFDYPPVWRSVPTSMHSGSCGGETGFALILGTVVVAVASMVVSLAVPPRPRYALARFRGGRPVAADRGAGLPGAAPLRHRAAVLRTRLRPSAFATPTRC